MTLEKIELVDQIEVVANGIVQVKTKTAVLENGVEITRAFHRHMIYSGQDYSKESQRVQAVCSAVHVPETIAAYQATFVEQNTVAQP